MHLSKTKRALLMAHSEAGESAPSEELVELRARLAAVPGPPAAAPPLPAVPAALTAPVAPKEAAHVRP